MPFKELTEETSLSKSTISRLVNRMAEEKIVVVEEKGKQKLAQLALTGKLIRERE